MEFIMKFVFSANRFSLPCVSMRVFAEVAPFDDASSPKNLAGQAMHRATAWLTLILFGATALLGQGLHLLVGCHPITHRALHEEQGLKTSHAADPHIGCCSCCGRSGDAAEDDAQDRLIATHDHDCLVCRFLAQGRDLPRLAAPPDVRFVRPYAAELSLLRVPLRRCDAYQARAPPAGNVESIDSV
jgi:hypothetical protein